MISRTLLRVALAITLPLGIATACGGADALAPAPLIGVADTTVVGSWLMESVNGRSLPYFCLDGGTLRLERDGTYSTSLTVRCVSNIPQIRATTGTFTAGNGVVTLRSAGAVTMSGTATAQSLKLAAVEANGVVYAFVR